MLADLGIAVWLARQRNEQRTGHSELVWRGLADVADTALWSALVPDADQEKFEVMALRVGLAAEAGALAGRSGFWIPLSSASTAVFVRLVRGQRLAIRHADWPLFIYATALGARRLDSLVGRLTRQAEVQIAASAAAAREEAVAGLGLVTASVADIVRDAAWKAEQVVGRRTGWQDVAEWKAARVRWAVSEGREFLVSVLHSWEDTQTHPDISRHVRFAVRSADRLVVLSPSQATALRGALDEEQLSGSVPVRVLRPSGRRQPTGSTSVRVGDEVIQLPGALSLHVPWDDPTTWARLCTGLFMLKSILPTEGAVPLRAALPPAVAGMALAAVPPGRLAKRQARNILAAATALNVVHAAAAGRTARHPREKSGPARFVGRQGLIGLMIMYGLERSWKIRLAGVGALGVVGLAGWLAAPERHASIFLGDVAGVVPGLISGIAIRQAVDGVLDDFTLDGAAVASSVDDALRQAGDFFHQRIARVEKLCLEIDGDADSQLKLEIQDLCRQARELLQSAGTTT